MNDSRKRSPDEFPKFDDYLRERGLFDKVSFAAEKMMIARQLQEEMAKRQLTKAKMAEAMGTSRAQLDRLLNPSEQNVTLETIARAAQALGRRLHISLV